MSNKEEESLHPYDKWIATRAEIEEAAVGRKALIRQSATLRKRYYLKLLSHRKYLY